MAGCDVFLSFRGCEIRKSFTEMLHTFINDEEQREAAIGTDVTSFIVPDFEFNNTFGLWAETFVSPVLYVDIHSWNKKWSNTSDFDEEKFLVSGKCGSVYRGEISMVEMQSWKNALVEAMVIADIMFELRNLLAKSLEKIPRSAFCFYPDHFSNLQKKKGISWKVAVTDAANATRIFGFIMSLIV